MQALRFLYRNKYFGFQDDSSKFKIVITHLLEILICYLRIFAKPLNRICIAKLYISQNLFPSADCSHIWGLFWTYFYGDVGNCSLLRGHVHMMSAKF